MPVDPNIQGVLTLIEQNSTVTMASGTPQQARDMFRMFTTTFRDPATLAPVASVEDIEIPGPAQPIPARIYRPETDADTVPTLLFIHGGGFVIGDIETHDDQARLVCRDAGAVVVSIDYRLAPEHKFPAGYEDCLAALRWVGDNVSTLGGDADRLAVGGDSAGGNLSAGVALASRASGPKLAAQLLIYPGVDFVEGDAYPSRVENAEGYFLTAEDMLWFRSQYLPDEASAGDLRASVIAEKDLTGAPPAVIATAEFDPLRDEGEAYAKALADAGVETRLHRYDGMIHGFFGMGTFSPGAAQAVSAICADLKDLLG